MEKTRRGVEKMGRTFSSSSRAIGLLHSNAFENRRRLADKSRSGGAYGLVDLLCSPNAHTRMG
jgi:hypothetical protein